MSHYTKIECKVDDIEALKKALTEMGFSFREGAHQITSYGQTRTFELSVVKNGKQLPVGWIKEEDGLHLEGDFYNTGINSAEFGKEVAQKHTKHKTSDWLTRKGYRVTYETNEKGQTVVVGNRW